LYGDATDVPARTPWEASEFEVTDEKLNALAEARSAESAAVFKKMLIFAGDVFSKNGK